MLSAERRHKQDLQEVSADVKDLVKKGKVDEAIRVMQEAGATPSEIRSKIRQLESPQRSLKNAKKAYQYMDEGERERLQRQMNLR